MMCVMSYVTCKVTTLCLQAGALDAHSVVKRSSLHSISLSVTCSLSAPSPRPGTWPRHNVSSRTSVVGVNMQGSRCFADHRAAVPSAVYI